MAKRIENNDLFGADLFKKTQTDVKSLITELNLLEKELIAVATQQQKVLNAQDNKSFDSIQKTKKAVKELSETERKAATIKQQKLNLERRLDVANATRTRDTVRLSEQIKKQNQLTKDGIRETTKSLGAYTNLSAKLNRLRKEYKDLALTEGTTTKKTKDLAAQIQKLDGKLKTVDKTVGQSQRNVGNYGSAWSRIGGVLKGGLGVLGLSGGLAGLSRIVTSSIGVFTSFEKANSGLEAVLGATDVQMLKLSEDAKRLGSITSFTASEVTGLQTSFARLGFPTEDIILMTESTLNSAAAMGSGLEETAALTGATLKAFGLDASESARVNDVLAKSTSASALDFAKLSSAMSTIAPVANSFGFSLEGTTSLLGQLANAGFDASSSATATKNILLNLADSNGKLAKSLKEPVTDLPSLVKGLKQLKGEGIDLAKALNLTDKRSVAAFSTFLNGADDVLALNTQLENAGGTAQAMADTQLDNLSGSVTILNSAWEGFILSLEDGSGAFSRLLRNIVDVFTEILSLLTGTEKLNSEMTKHEKTVRKYAKAFLTISKVMGALIVSFITYKVVMAASNVLTKAYTSVTKALTVAKRLETKATKGAVLWQKTLNFVMKANPIGLLITLIAGLITAYYLLSDATSFAEKTQIASNKAQRDGAKLGKENAENQTKQANEKIRLLEEEIKLKKALAKTDKEVEQLDAELIKGKDKILKFDVATNEQQIEVANSKVKRLQKLAKNELTIIDDKIAAEKKLQEAGKQRQNAEGEAISFLPKFQAERNELIIQTTSYISKAEAIRQKFVEKNEDLNKQIITNDIELTEVLSAESKKQGKITADKTKELLLLGRRLEDLRNQAIENDFERRSAILKTQSKRDVEAIKGYSVIEINLRLALQLKLQNDLIKLNEDFQKKKDKLNVDAIQDETEKLIQLEVLKSQAKIKIINDLYKTESEEKQKLIDAENKRTQAATTKILNDSADKQLKVNQDKINAEAEFQKAKFLQTKGSFKNEEAFNEAKAKSDYEIEKKRLNAQLDLLKDKNDEESKLKKEQLKGQIADLEKFNTKAKEQAAELKQFLNDAINELGNFVDEAFAKRLSAIDKQLSKVGQRIDQLRAKANAGQLDAKESLAFEQKKEAELERERAATEKRRAKTKAFFAVLSSFNANDGDIGKTIKDVALLKALATTFSSGSAYDGVDDTGGRGNVDKKGGKMWTLHPNEQVWSKKDRGEVGFRNRDEIKNIVGLYDSGILTNLMQHDKSQELINPLSFRLNGLTGNSDVVNKLSQLNQSIKGIDIPEGMINIDEVRGFINLVSRKGSKKTTERSKLHK